MPTRRTTLCAIVFAGLSLGACRLATVTAAPATPPEPAPVAPVEPAPTTPTEPVPATPDTTTPAAPDLTPPAPPVKPPARPVRPRRTTTASPSVLEAALLKLGIDPKRGTYFPPNDWIRHYLGDDRFKIVGGTWPVVSTEMDAYYHRPECPNMLKQPAGTVIGFMSAEEAVEAGYTADPVCHPEEPAGAFAGPGITVLGSTVNSAPQQITLADGSTLTLPARWRRLGSTSQQNQGGAFSIDTFRPARGAGAVIVASMTFTQLPQNVNLGALLTPEGFRKYLQGDQSLLNASGQVNSGMDRLATMLDSFSVSSATLGGMRGVLLKPKRGASVPGFRGSVIVVGRGQTIHEIYDATGGAPGVDTIIKTYRPR